LEDRRIPLLHFRLSLDFVKVILSHAAVNLSVEILELLASLHKRQRDNEALPQARPLRRAIELSWEQVAR
jgi:hypothetical protein